MRILVLTFFYPPDLSAGSFRSHGVITSLCARNEIKGCRSSCVEILTTQPNRYQTFRMAAPPVETSDQLTVRRFALPSHAGGVRDQAAAFLAYATAVHQYVRGRRYDVVFATSSRLMTAVLGAHVARSVGAPLYLDIRDILVDTVGDVFPGPLTPLALAGFRAMEQYAIARAEHVNLVSEGFASYFQKRYPGMRHTFLPNGIDTEFIDACREKTPARQRASDDPLNIVYAGNFGASQSLHTIIPELAEKLRQRATFTLIGDGSRRAILEQRIREAGCSTVTCLPPMKRDALIAAYRDADVLFLHLNCMEAFTRVLPSKIFEYAAMGRPILAGVRGFAAEFLRREVSNTAVFPPDDALAAISALSTLELKDTARVVFVEKFARQRICDMIAAGVVSVAATVNL